MTNLDKLKNSLYRHTSKKISELFPNESDLSMTVETEEEDIYINISVKISKDLSKENND